MGLVSYRETNFRKLTPHSKPGFQALSRDSFETSPSFQRYVLGGLTIPTGISGSLSENLSSLRFARGQALSAQRRVNPFDWPNTQPLSNSGAFDIGY